MGLRFFFITYRIINKNAKDAFGELSFQSKKLPSRNEITKVVLGHILKDRGVSCDPSRIHLQAIQELSKEDFHSFNEEN